MTATVVREIAAPRARVAEILGDGWTYPAWVVGASRMRKVDVEWPRAGATLHHSVGVWPLVIDDTTSVVESDLPGRLVLQARAWPFGRAQITFELEDLGADRCRVTIKEKALDRIGMLPDAVTDPPITFRNVEMLRRLDALVTRPDGPKG